MKTRKEVLIQAYKECLKEMYRWSQPSIDLDSLVKAKYEDSAQNPLYKRHYLSPDNFKYIKERYMEAYGLIDSWDYTFEIIKEQLTNGRVEYTKDMLKPYYKIKPLKADIIYPKDFDIVINALNDIQEWGRGKSYEINSFNFTMCLGSSPYSNAETVEKYWRSLGYDFTIKDFKIEDVIYGGVNGEYEDITEDEFIDTLKLPL